MKKLAIVLFTAIIPVFAGTPALSQASLFHGDKAVVKNWDDTIVMPGGEFQLNTELINGSAPFSQTGPSVAFNGTVYLIVWTDIRNMLDIDIYGARLDINGVLIDSAGILICKAKGNQGIPAVVSNGNIFLVVWEDGRNDKQTGTDIYGARVDGDGTVMDPDGIVISAENNLQETPRIASIGQNFFVVWADQRTGTDSDIYGTFVTSGGAVTHAEGLEICTQDSWQGNPDICTDGFRYFLVWADQRDFSKDLYGAFIKADGTISHINGFGLVTMFNNQDYPSVTCSDTHFFIAWEEDQAGSNTKIYGSRVSATGILLDADGLLIGNSTGFDSCLEPVVVSDGNSFIVTYSIRIGDFVDDYNVMANRISSEGQVLDTYGLVISDGPRRQKSPAILFDGTNYLIAWEDNGTGDDRVMVAYIDVSGFVSPVEGFEVTKGFNNQLYGDVAFDNTNYMAVWCDTRNEKSTNIFAARINDQGLVLDQQAIAVTSGEEDCLDPAIAFNGANYLVVWAKGSDIYGARLSTAGVVLDPGGFVIYQDGHYKNSPAIASDRSNWMVVWEDRYTSNEEASNIYGAIITPGGTVLQPQSIPVLVYQFDQVNPDITFDGTNFIVVWHDYRAGFSGVPNIFGTRVAADGTVLDNNGTGIAINQSSPMMDPAVDFDGTNLMVCWTDGFYPDLSIKGVRFTRELAVLDEQPLALSTGTDCQHTVSIAFNSEFYMILWMDYFEELTYRILMAKVATDGTIAETGVFSELDGHLTFPAIAHGPLKQALGIFSAFMENIGDTVVNGHRLLGKLAGQGGPGIAEHYSEEMIMAARLWPNPASSAVTVGFELARSAFISISIVDAEGKLIREVISNRLTKGVYALETGTSLFARGMYFIVLKAGEQSVSLKLLVK